MTTTTTTTTTREKRRKLTVKAATSSLSRLVPAIINGTTLGHVERKKEKRQQGGGGDRVSTGENQFKPRHDEENARTAAARREDGIMDGRPAVSRAACRNRRRPHALHGVNQTAYEVTCWKGSYVARRTHDSLAEKPASLQRNTYGKVLCLTRLAISACCGHERSSFVRRLHANTWRCSFR